MTNYKLQVRDIEKAATDFGVAEETISEVIHDICNKTRDSIEESVLDARHMEAVFTVPLADMKICSFEGDSFNTHSIEEAEKLCEKVRVRAKRLGTGEEPWDQLINADTGEILAEKFHFNNFQGIMFGGEVVGEGIYEVYLKPVLKYAEQDRKFSDFFE